MTVDRTDPIIDITEAPHHGCCDGRDNRAIVEWRAFQASLADLHSVGERVVTHSLRAFLT